MIKVIRILIGAGLIGAAAIVAIYLQRNRPQAEVVDYKGFAPAVEVQVVAAVDREIKVPSQGVVEPRKVTQLSVEVGGRVEKVSEKFDKGGEFDKGEILLWLDDSNYENNVIQAEAALKEAELNLKTEEAKAAQAKRDWDSLKRGAGKANELTLRGPQVASAKARVKASKSAKDKATRDLEKTKIKAPFAGRISQLQTEEGSYLMAGSRVAEFYTTEPYELRLPISLDELQFVKNVKGGGKDAEVGITTDAGGDVFTWKGKVIRNESEIERTSRSIYLVAEMEGRSEEEGIRLQPGLFVQATISGETLKEVYEIPMKALIGLDEVLIVGEEDGKTVLRTRRVKVLRRIKDLAIVSVGLEEGDRVCLTPLVDVIDGMEVRIVGEEKKDEKKSGKTIKSNT